jgi:iron(III) transport system substrate-binding protein
MMPKLSRRFPRFAPAVAVAIVLLAGACGGSGSGPSTQAAASGGLQQVCDAGAKEGKVVYWNNLAKPDDIIEKFNEAYPDIDVQSTTLRPDDAAQRLLVEQSAGRGISADVIYGGLDVFGSAIKAGLIDKSVDWATLGVPKEIVTDSNMVRLYRTGGGLTYNTEKVKPEDLPSTWEELIDPKWAGKVIVDPRGRPFDQLALAWGDDKALEYVQRLKQVVKPVVIEGGTAGLVAVAGGQGLFTTGGRASETEEQKAKGAPLEIKYLDVVPTLDSYHGVVTGTKHPNAARCLVAWMATQGAEFHQQTELKTNQDVPPGAPAGAQVLAIDTPQKAEQVAAMSKKVGDILQ